MGMCPGTVVTDASIDVEYMGPGKYCSSASALRIERAAQAEKDCNSGTYKLGIARPYHAESRAILSVFAFLS